MIDSLGMIFLEHVSSCDAQVFDTNGCLFQEAIALNRSEDCAAAIEIADPILGRVSLPY